MIRLKNIHIDETVEFRSRAEMWKWLIKTIPTKSFMYTRYDYSHRVILEECDDAYYVIYSVEMDPYIKESKDD